MLFVVNSVFNKDIKESTTKEEILKMMPEIKVYKICKMQENMVLLT